MQFLRRYPRFHLPTNALVTTLSFGFALPVAIALFPQMSKVISLKSTVRLRNLEENIVILQSALCIADGLTPLVARASAGRAMRLTKFGSHIAY